jgi:hypothetical protein
MAKASGGMMAAGAALNLTLTKLPDTPGRLKRGSGTLPRKPFKPSNYITRTAAASTDAGNALLCSFMYIAH